MTGHRGGAGEQHGYTRLFGVLLGLAVLAAIAGLGWSYHLSGRLTNAKTQLLQAQQQNQKLASALNETNAQLKITNQTRGHSLAGTQKQLQQRARDLLRRQQAAAKRKQSEQQINSVSNGPSGTDASGGNSATGSTPTEAPADEPPLQSMKGDLGIASGLIATNQHELDILKQKGGRNYYQFTLEKGKKLPISTVSLELKKADAKHNRYTLIVYTNDIKIQKKDRELNQPVQFYTGKDNYLYEVVVNSIEKNEVKGYLATPLNAPVPVSPSGN